MKIQTKLFLVLVPVALFSAALILFLSDASIKKVLMRGLAERGFLQLSDISGNIDLGVKTKDEKLLLPLLNTARERMRASYAAVLDPSGIVLAHTNVLEKGKVYNDETTRRALGYEEPGFQSARYQDKDIIDVAVPVWSKDDDFLLASEKGGKKRIGTLRLGLPLDEAAATRQRILQRVALILLIAGAVMVAVIFWFLRRMLYPIHLLVELIHKIGRGEYGIAVPIVSHDEIGELAQSFNRMSADLATTTVSKDFLNGVIRSMMDIMVVTDSQGYVKSVNPAASAVLGYSEHDLIGKPIVSLLDAKASESAEIAAMLAQKGFVKDMELSMLTKARARIPVLLSGSALRDREGKPDGVVIVAKDITERLLAEAALRDSEERLRLLLDSMSEGIYAIDLNGNCILANRACLKILKYKDVDEILGKNVHQLIHYSRVDGAPLSMDQCTVYKAVKEGVATHADDEVFWRADKSNFPVEYWAYPIWRNGKTAGAVVNFADITERKRLEMMVTQSEKLSAVGQLAAGVAHEINNPLGVILGFSQSVIRKIKDSDVLFMPIKSIEREALRCRNLVQNLLTFSRQNKPRMEAFDLNSVVNDTLNLMEAQARVKSTEIFKELGKIDQVLGDKNQMQQIIVNLCNNAMDAMSKGGKIVVRTRQNDNAWVYLEVEDNGSGIPDDIRDKIFNPFFTTKEVGKGTGLGLSLVFEIVQRHHGRIELNTQVGKGTTFIVSFPVLCQREASRS